MLFNSPEFLLFLAVVYCTYRILPFRLQNYLLLGASYLFYGWWDSRFLVLTAFSTIIDFWVGLTMDRGRLSRWEKVVPALFFAGAAILFLGLDPEGILPDGRGLLDQSELVRPIFPWVCLGVVLLLSAARGAYALVIRLDEARRRRVCLAISVVTQIGLLSTFKYFNFFVDSATEVLQDLGFQTNALHLNLILPVGISFYTFQSLSYAIDIYRRELKPTGRFFDFALFVAYFPQLVAGPIERARNLIPQISKPRIITWDQSMRGLYLIVLGMFKKVAIADGVAPSVDQIFNSTGIISWADVVVGTSLFAIQIYCDFSGYSDIARGVSKLFGIDLMVNFNQPYFAKNPRDFWKRWHISLSTWLSDYLYKPLGGNRGSLAFTCRNLMITMLLGGLWHGAAWNYVLWGFYHGTLLCMHRIWNRMRGAPHLAAVPAGTIFQVALICGFFMLTLYGWLLFRARSLAQVVEFTTLLITDFGNLDYGGSIPRISAVAGVALLGTMELVQYRSGNPHFYQRLPRPALGFLIAMMIFITFMGMSNEPAQFIYFQF